MPDRRRSEGPGRADGEAVTGERAMVVTTDRLASGVGVEILRAGGNAVDAAVATALALAVVNPEAGNLGGGGYLVLRTAKGEVATLDFRSTAPRKATPDMFLDAQGGVGNRAVLGHLAVAVPGSVAGLWEAHGRFGSRPWAELVDPAIGLAQGFTVGERLLRSFTADVMDGLGAFPRSAEIFLPGGEPPRLGTVFRQPALAVTLQRIRERGADGYYGGETAAAVAAEMRRGGGVLTREDLRAYRPIWRSPLRFRYRGHTVISMPPSSSGGVALAEIAHILSPFHLGAIPWHGPRHVHLLAEAWRRAYADRNHYLGDPAFVTAPLQTLTSPAYGVRRGKDISSVCATRSVDVAPGAGGRGREGGSTTHLSIVDPFGNAVSLTTTLNTWYGSKVVAEGTGVLLNNEMDDFTAKPGAPNHFGLVQGEANAIAPGKRPLSAMTPTLVLDGAGGLFAVLGTPGGATIVTTVFQLISNMLDHGMAADAAVSAPRVHHQHLPDQIWYEAGGLSADVVEALGDLGHVLVERDEPSGDAQVVTRLTDGSLRGVSDPRRGGAASGF